MNATGMRGAIRERARGMREEYLRDLKRIVDMDSPTDDKAGVDAVGRIVRGWLEAGGGAVESFPQTERGDHLRATWQGTEGSPTVVLVGHIDTVYPTGSVAQRPFTISGNRATGCGVSDMKSGILSGIYALRILRDLDIPLPTVRFVINTDEEVGSLTSRALIEETAKGADAAYILEPGRAVGPGCVVTTRKGIGLYDLRVAGKAAHAGGEPWRGRSANLEMAHKIIALHALTTPGLSAGNTEGTSVNVGVVRGGSRRNVVAAEAYAEIDVRVPTAAAIAEIEAAMRAIAAHATVPDTTAALTGGINRPPMERTDAQDRLLAIAGEILGGWDIPVEAIGTGGGSDGNFTAAIGTPTLDALGPMGGGAHSPEEYMSLPSLPDRIALVASLIAETVSRQA
ncbi:MAG: M20 family metallopeptidase [Chloroflexota bacterium]|nr:M20 family metallopeptidase [Chloroflexota bacterium]